LRRALVIGDCAANQENPLKFDEQTLPECATLADRLQGMRIAMLTLRDTECRLVSQPMTPLEMDASGAIWLIINRHSRIALHVQANLPADTMNLAFSDDSNSTYVSITAGARLSDDQQRKRELWSSLVRPWFPDGAHDADLTLLCLEPMEAEIWDAPGSAVVRLLALASAAVTGKPVDLGDHEELHNLDAHRV
jgi:general stress protein 26